MFLESKLCGLSEIYGGHYCVWVFKSAGKFYAHHQVLVAWPVEREEKAKDHRGSERRPCGHSSFPCQSLKLRSGNENTTFPLDWSLVIPLIFRGSVASNWGATVSSQLSGGRSWRPRRTLLGLLWEPCPLLSLVFPSLSIHLLLFSLIRKRTLTVSRTR